MDDFLCYLLLKQQGEWRGLVVKKKTSKAGKKRLLQTDCFDSFSPFVRGVETGSMYVQYI